MRLQHITDHNEYVYYRLCVYSCFFSNRLHQDRRQWLSSSKESTRD